MKKSFTILFTASESVPFVKTGGLGDVVYALALALKRAGHNPLIIIPRYRKIPKEFSGERVCSGIPVPLSNNTVHTDLYCAETADGIPVYLVDRPDYFDREELYGTAGGDYPDNAERFIFFSRAVSELIQVIPERIDIIHAHDWHTALVPLYISLKRRPPQNLPKTLFTIHNLSHQGLFWRFDMHLTGLPWEYFTPDGLEFYGDLNLMKAGIIYSDALNTVSPSYCREIQTPEFGCGLDGLLRSVNHKLFGILNGIDTDKWNPETDSHIEANYSGKDLSGKRKCKESLIRELKLDMKTDDLLAGVISRLSSQKGIDLLETAVPELVKANVSFVVLGKGDAHYVNRMTDLEKVFPKKFRFIHAFDDIMAHKIEAGADVFLMPSRFEPCGLNQMYSMRYGTVPIVRSTGGLEDTVHQFDKRTRQGTGFKFFEYQTERLVKTTLHAQRHFDNREIWHTLMQNGMSQDFSWDRSARGYIELYKHITSIQNDV